MPIQPQNLPNTTESKTPHHHQKHKSPPTTSIYLHHTYTPHKTPTAPKCTPTPHITLPYTLQAVTSNKSKQQHYHLQTQQVLQLQVHTTTFRLDSETDS